MPVISALGRWWWEEQAGLSNRTEFEASMGLSPKKKKKWGGHMGAHAFDRGSLNAAKWMDLYLQHCPG